MIYFYKQCNQVITFCAVFVYILCRDCAIVSQLDSDDIQLFDGSIIDVQDDPELSKSVELDNQLMREMYVMSTDKVITHRDIKHMITAVGSKPSIRLSNAVSTIVNLKLIRRLQFHLLDSLYTPCAELDHQNEKGHETEGNSINDDGIRTRPPQDMGSSSNGSFKLAFSEDMEPVCMSKFEHQHNYNTDKQTQRGNCSRESCRFYLHCVLHKRQCSDGILEIATTFLLNNKVKLPFATGDTRTDRLIAKAIALSQFADPVEAIKFSTSKITDEGEQAGFLQARVLAHVRSGLNAQNINLIVKDLDLAHSLDETNEDSIYRKVAVFVAISRYFEALEVLEVGLTSYPNNADFYEMKGSCHFRLQELAEAEDCFRKALELNVDNQHDVMQKLGLVLYRQGKLANAIVVYKELLQISPTDSNALISIAHCYRQQGEGKRAMLYANKAVKFEEGGKIQLLFRGSLQHSLGNDYLALGDFKTCLKYHKTHELCTYHAAISYASLGRFFESVKCLVKVTSGIDTSSPNMQSNSHYVKASYLINYYRYLHSMLDQPFSHLDLDLQLRSGFKDGWAKGAPLELSEFFASEQRTLSPDIPVVVSRSPSSYDSSTQKLICKAKLYGRLMQVKADSFLPNQRFNLAMGLATIHVGQYLRNTWMNSKKSVLKKLLWKELYELTLPYRRLADMETPVLWLSMIYREEHSVRYHNEVLFYRSQVKNLRMKSYFDHVFGLMRRRIKDKIALHYSQNAHRLADVDIAKTPEDLVSIAKVHLPSQLAAKVPSVTDPSIHLDGATIILAPTAYGSAYLYMNTPTTLIRSVNYDLELTYLYTSVISLASKLRTNSLDVDATIDEMLSMSYFFFNLCPLSRGSASVGLSTLVGMFLSIDKEMAMSLPAGKMLDMEATLAGGRGEFIFSVKNWFKLTSRKKSPITTLPLVSATFPTVRSVMEVLALVDEIDCDND